MNFNAILKVVAFLAIAFVAVCPTVAAQTEEVYHQIEGRLRVGNMPAANVRVRLVRQAEMRPITETFSRPDGQFTFNRVTEGDYLIETFETDQLEATSTVVNGRAVARGSRSVFHVQIDLIRKTPAALSAPGVVNADVDLRVSKEALKHYRAGMKALEAEDFARGLSELRAAINVQPDYYAARLELGRELRRQKQFAEAAEALAPLVRLAPKKAEGHLEYGVALLSLGRREEAVGELQRTVELEEPNWAAHLYLGWALQEADVKAAGQHFIRALAIDEAKAARAHLALARIANANGQTSLALQHLQSYLSLAPDASDAPAARQLAESLQR